MSHFPTLFYRSPGAHRGPPGTTYDYRAVADSGQLVAAFKDGWYPTLEDALAPDGFDAEAYIAQHSQPEPEPEAEPEPVVDEDAPTEREQLEARATRLGVTFTKGTKDATLRKKVKQAEEALCHGLNGD